MGRQPSTSTHVPTGAVKPFAALASFRAGLLAALLALVTLVLYWPATNHEFVSYDDPNYVTANPQVQNGLSWQGLEWAWLHPVSVNWHPITVLSHMLDCQLFGLKPWGHHLTNVLLHALNVVLVFFLVQQMTGASEGRQQAEGGIQNAATCWRSFFVAALFAVHPLRVESVAWISERKDLLSGLFGILTLIFYISYARKQMAVESGQARGRETPAVVAWPWALDYRLALCCFALGLLSKPMLVTWPFVLLLLDYWPMQRLQSLESRVQSLESEVRSPRSTAQSRQAELRMPAAAEDGEEARTARKSQIVNRILLEKAPFLLAAAVFSVVTLVVQNQGGAVKAVEDFPLSIRCENALVSYCRYLGKLLWPTRLAVYYPHPGHWPVGVVLLAGGLILGATMLLFIQRERRPFLLIGWLWYCGTLVPVIGLVQVGGQAMADRYTYLPSLGLLIAAVWGAYELTSRWRYHTVLLAWAGTTAIVLCLVLTRHQLAYWKDSEALFRHALAVTENNCLAHNSLGTALDAKGHADEAISHYSEALRLNPSYPEAHYNLGNELANRGAIDEAISHYEDAIRLKPDYADAYYNMGRVLAAKGRLDEAIGQFQAATRTKPDYADAYFNLGILLAGSGQTNAAISAFQAAIRLRPGDADAHNFLGMTLSRKGEVDKAISQYREAIRLKPDYAEARNNLALALGGTNAAAGR